MPRPSSRTTNGDLPLVGVDVACLTAFAIRWPMPCPPASVGPVFLRSFEYRSVHLRHSSSMTNAEISNRHTIGTHLRSFLLDALVLAPVTDCLQEEFGVGRRRLELRTRLLVPCDRNQLHLQEPKVSAFFMPSSWLLGAGIGSSSRTKHGQSVLSRLLLDGWHR